MITNTEIQKETTVKVKALSKTRVVMINSFGKEPKKYLVIKTAFPMMDIIPTTNQDWLNWNDAENNLKEFDVNESKVKIRKGELYNAEIINKNEVQIKSCVAVE